MKSLAAFPPAFGGTAPALRGGAALLAVLAGVAACQARSSERMKAPATPSTARDADAPRPGSPEMDARPSQPADATRPTDAKPAPGDARLPIDAPLDARPADARDSTVAPGDAGGEGVVFVTVPLSEPALGTVAVDDRYVYWTRFGGELVRLRKDDRDGRGTPEPIGQGVVASSVSFLVDAGSLYWPQGDRLIKLDLAALGSTHLALGQSLDGTALAIDAQAIHASDVGCRHIVSVPKDGSAPLAAQQALSSQGGASAVALDDTHVYCSAGAHAALYRRAKSGGAIELVTKIAPDDPADPFGKQIGGMAVVGELVYFIVHYSDLSQRWHLLMSVPRSGGEATMVARVDDASQVAVLHHDVPRNALFWLARSQPIGMMRFDLASSELSRHPIGQLQSNGAMAADASDLYVVGTRTITRVGKW